MPFDEPKGEGGGNFPPFENNKKKADASGDSAKKYRDIELEKNQKIEDVKEDLGQENAGEGYDRSQERSFDAVMKKDGEKQSASKGTEKKKLEKEGKVRTKEKERDKKMKIFKSMAIEVLKKISYALLTPEQKKIRYSNDAQKDVEKMSTYRHHAMVTPGKQAGIFDKDIEDSIKKAKKFAEKHAGHKGNEGMSAERGEFGANALGGLEPDDTPGGEVSHVDMINRGGGGFGMER